MTELKTLELKAKELGIKPSKDIIAVAKAIDAMRAIFQKAGFSPSEEYLKAKYANQK